MLLQLDSQEHSIYVLQILTLILKEENLQFYPEIQKVYSVLLFIFHMSKYFKQSTPEKVYYFSISQIWFKIMNYIAS